MDSNEQVVVKFTPEANLQLPQPSLLQFYKDIHERIYWITDEIDDGLLDLVSKIMDWNREDRYIPKENRKPIRLCINSVGGNLDIARVVVSIVEVSETPVMGIAMGIVASAASMIFLACHKRVALANSTYLLHKGSIHGMSGNYEEVKRSMQDYEKTVNELVSFYITHTLYSEEEVKEKLNSGDWYLYNDEAQKHGIIEREITSINEII